MGTLEGLLRPYVVFRKVVAESAAIFRRDFCQRRVLLLALQVQ